MAQIIKHLKIKAGKTAKKAHCHTRPKHWLFCKTTLGRWEKLLAFGNLTVKRAIEFYSWNVDRLKEVNDKKFIVTIFRNIF